MTSVATREHDDSGEYSDASQDIDHNNSGNDVGQPESDYDSQGSDSERSDRDQENQETERRVDDDEDRSNPQYIPKRGTFYEHDDRTAASGEESTNTTCETASDKKEGSETPAERRRPPRKSDVINKWSHDKYNENEQVPKSRDELVAIYGYDIRNEDAPPHARRNRRYGRGPNKYTRTWEDEEAYKRQTAAQPLPRKPPNPEDFPELDVTRRISKKTRGPRPRSKSQPTSNESLENGSDNQLRRNASIKSPRGKIERPSRPLINKSAVRPSPKLSPKDKMPPIENLTITTSVTNTNNKSAVRPFPKLSPKDKMPPIENLTITTSVTNNNQGQPQRKVNATVAQQRPVPTEQAKRKPLQQPQQPNNVARNRSPPQPSPPQSQQRPQPLTNQQPSQPAATGEARGGSKRYSSLRQRPLAEAYSPQPQQQQQPPQQQQQQQIRYTGVDGAEYAAGGAPAPHQGSPVPQLQPQLMHQQVHRAGVPPQHGPSPPHQQLPQPQHSQQVRLGLLEQQQLVSHPHPLHNMPQQHAIGQLQATQGYAPPAMMPAQYMQPAGGGGSGGVFAGAMYPQPPAPYPMYPHHNYQTRPLAPKHEPARAIIPNYHPPGPAPDLLATQAGGVTYYTCVEQDQLPRPQRRPINAIPIVRPAPERAANSSDKDNIDRIVENMFVRKPWPATQGTDSKDKPQENRNSQEPTSKDSSQPNSLTSSSISTDSKPSEPKEERAEERVGEDRREEKDTQESEPQVLQETIQTDA